MSYVFLGIFESGGETGGAGAGAGVWDIMDCSKEGKHRPAPSRKGDMGDMAGLTGRGG